MADIHDTHCVSFYELRLRQNDNDFRDNILNCIFLFENFWILDQISLRYVMFLRV